LFIYKRSYFEVSIEDIMVLQLGPCCTKLEGPWPRKFGFYATHGTIYGWISKKIRNSRSWPLVHVYNDSKYETSILRSWASRLSQLIPKSHDKESFKVHIATTTWWLMVDDCGLLYLSLFLVVTRDNCAWMTTETTTSLTTSKWLWHKRASYLKWSLVDN
jgi:hypothetical protein